jgi:hypothetical protein
VNRTPKDALMLLLARRTTTLGLALSLLASGCGGEEPADHPSTGCKTLAVKAASCGSHSYEWQGLAAGPAEASFDADLDQHATRLERQFHGINAHGTNVTADLTVAVSRTEERQLITDFVASDAWDFEAFAGRSVVSAVDSFGKTAGMYAGAGIAADALRYATLRDQGADCADVERARQYLDADLDVLHMVTAITGIPGGVARGFAHRSSTGTVSRCPSTRTTAPGATTIPVASTRASSGRIPVAATCFPAGCSAMRPPGKRSQTTPPSRKRRKRGCRPMPPASATR